MKIKVFVGLVLVVIFVGAVRQALDVAGESDRISMSELDGRTFVSEALTDSGKPYRLAGATSLMFAFEKDGLVSASAGCNDLWTQVKTLSHGRLESEGRGWLSTKIACGSLEKQESWFYQLLSNTPTINYASGRLTLSGGKRRVVFRELTADPKAILIGPTWVVESVVAAGKTEPAPSGPATEIVFEDGTYRGSTGCYEVTGTWEHQLGMARISGSVTGGCSSGPEAETSPLVGFGSAPFFVEESGGSVRLTTDRGSGVVLRRK